MIMFSVQKILEAELQLEKGREKLNTAFLGRAYTVAVGPGILYLSGGVVQHRESTRR